MSLSSLRPGRKRREGCKKESISFDDELAKLTISALRCSKLSEKSTILTNKVENVSLKSYNYSIVSQQRHVFFFLFFFYPTIFHRGESDDDTGAKTCNAVFRVRGKHFSRSRYNAKCVDSPPDETDCVEN